MCPYRKAEHAERNRLPIRDEERLSGRCLRGEQIVHGQDVGVSHVGYVGEVVETICVTDDERRLELGDALLDGADELVVSGTADDRRADGAGRHLWAVGFEYERFGCDLAALLRERNIYI